MLRVRPTSTFRAFTLAAAGIFCVAVLLGMDLWTTSSTVPALSDVPSVERYENDLRAFGIETPFALARTPAALLSRHPDMTPERSIMLTETAKLVTLRGLGTVHARRLRDLGIFTQCRLARADAPTLWSAYHDRPLTHDPPTVTPPERPTPAEVRVWVRSAVRACSRELRDEP